MNRLSIVVLILVLMAQSGHPATDLFTPNLIHHNLQATISPEQNRLMVSDAVTLPKDIGSRELQFLLSRELKIKSTTPGVSLEVATGPIDAAQFGLEDSVLASGVSMQRYTLRSTQPMATFTLEWQGRINHEIRQSGKEYARGFSESPGIISSAGVYLAGSSRWIPIFSDELLTFSLTTSLPEGWDSVSQGTRTDHRLDAGRQITCWQAFDPMEEIYLIAAPFSQYSRKCGEVDVMAFLRKPEESLAVTYLETTGQYLEMYRRLIGPFPFSKFALVENFWETGYGMPSFTLLGEKVIRFPFILHSSYPHELLHNWWGNCVYVDSRAGNWCEGITAYLADHLIKEQRGQGHEHRRATLQNYTDYVKSSDDFPLKSFRSRFDAASEAVGYGKAAMMWNMLREMVGDKDFIKGFQTFFQKNRFRAATFDDIKQAFNEVTGKDLDSFFRQWVNRVGAPDLRLSGVALKPLDNTTHLAFTISQIQKEEPFALDIPVAIFFDDKVELRNVHLAAKEKSYDLVFPEKPIAMKVDPQFNVFRKLHHLETPPALSKIFGDQTPLILLPSKADELHGAAYCELADTWKKDPTKKIEVKLDRELATLPADRPVWLFGLENAHMPAITQGIGSYDAQIGASAVRLGQETFSCQDKSVVIVARHPGDPSSVIALLASDRPSAIPGLARKLPHYGKYSYLVFEGSEPSIIAKGQWEAVASPLNFRLNEEKYLLKNSRETPISVNLPVRQALAMLPPLFSEERMLKAVQLLADDKLAGRGLGTSGLDEAGRFIEENFQKAGLEPAGENQTFFQTWEDAVDAAGRRSEVSNIIGCIPGTDEKLDGESVVICAHYDHLGLGWPDVRTGNKGKIHPGADDNGSGLAVMLEVAHALGKSFKPARTIIFAAFTGEENGRVGSRHYLKEMKKFPAKKVIGVINLDTVGRLGTRKLMVLSGNSAREWKYMFMGIGYVTGVETEVVSQDLDSSDQHSFIEAGVPGVQLFSGAHSDYHSPGDTADRIDYPGLVKVAAVAREAIVYLAERREALDFQGGKAADASKGGGDDKKGERRVSTGCMPDFTFPGPGVKIGDVSENSAAALAGLQKGDIIVELAGTPIDNLPTYSRRLKVFKPGDEVNLCFLRGEQRIWVKLKLGER